MEPATARPHAGAGKWPHVTRVSAGTATHGAWTLSTHSPGIIGPRGKRERPTPVAAGFDFL
jgi:hypothetical protein